MTRWTAWLALGALAVSACDRSPAQAPVAALPGDVASAVDSLARQCSEAAGIPHSDAAARRGDFNSDGREDFVVYAGWMVCDNAASIYGDREKDVAVFAGDAAGAAPEAFRESVFDVVIQADGGTPRLVLTVSGANCGKAPAATFSEESFCDRPIAWDAATNRFHYEAVPASGVR